MMKLLLALAAAISVFTSPMTADDWPQFRGPTGDGHADAAADLPTAWSRAKNIKWSKEIPGQGYSSPVVSGDVVWLTSASQDGRENWAICLELATGAIRHRVRLWKNDQPSTVHLQNSYASPTPVVEGDRVWVHFGNYGTACLDAQTGRVIWQRRDFECYDKHGPGSSPVLWEDWLLLHFDGLDVQYVVALDKTTGKTVWKQNRDIDYGTDDGERKKAFCTPLVIDVDGRAEMISPAANAAIAYDPRTGDELWRVTYIGDSATARPVYASGLVLISTSCVNAQLLAVRPGGRGDVTESHVKWKLKAGVPMKPSPLVVEDLVYLMHDGGVLQTVELATGKLVWKRRLGGNFSASPLYADGKIYLFDEAGTGHVIRPGRKFESLATNRLESGCKASPAVVGGSLLVRTIDRLYRIEALP